MNEEKLLSFTKKSLFLKFMLLSLVVFGIVLTHPMTAVRCAQDLPIEHEIG